MKGLLSVSMLLVLGCVAAYTEEFKNDLTERELLTELKEKLETRKDELTERQFKEQLEAREDELTKRQFKEQLEARKDELTKRQFKEQLEARKDELTERQFKEQLEAREDEPTQRQFKEQLEARADDLTLRQLLAQLKKTLETRQYDAETEEEFEERKLVGEYKRFSCLTNRVECEEPLPVCRDGPDGVGRCFAT